MPPLVGLPEHEVGQHVGVAPLPSGQKVLEPLVVPAVGHAVADHQQKCVLLQGEPDGLGFRAGVLETRREGCSRQPPDGALALDIRGRRAVLVERRLAGGQVRRQQVDGGEAPLLVAAEVQGGVHGPQGRLRRDARLEELLQQAQGHLALPLGLPAAAHTVAEDGVQGAPGPEPGEAVPAQALAFLGLRPQGHLVAQLLPRGGGGLGGGHGLGHQLPQLGVLPPAALPLPGQLAAVLPPEQQGRHLRIDGGEELRKVDAPGGEVDEIGRASCRERV